MAQIERTMVESVDGSLLESVKTITLRAEARGCGSLRAISAEIVMVRGSWSIRWVTEWAGMPNSST